MRLIAVRPESAQLLPYTIFYTCCPQLSRCYRPPYQDNYIENRFSEISRPSTDVSINFFMPIKYIKEANNMP